MVRKNFNTLNLSNPFFKYTFSFCAGLLLPCAFAPRPIPPCVFFSCAIILYNWLHSSPGKAFWHGFLFGLGAFGLGTSWIYISMHDHGNMGVMLSGGVTLIFVSVLALFPATQGLLFSRIIRHKNVYVSVLCLFPVFWVLWEWLRSKLFTGFPWLLIGNSQYASALGGYAPILGVYGISLLVALLSAMLLLVYLKRSSFTVSLTISSYFLLFASGLALSHIPWIKKTDPIQTVSLLQGNIPQSLKWNDNQIENILHIYLTMTKKVLDTQIIVWPEAALPTLAENVQPFLYSLNALAIQHHATIILGIPIYHPSTNQIFNGMRAIGNGRGIYLKRRLVPFGEYTPFRAFLSSFLNTLHIPFSDLTPGPKKQLPLMANQIPFASLICYEIAYPTEVLQSIQKTKFIVVLSDDSWFGNSYASAQQLEIAQMRAAETRQYVLYSTNTGVTAVIDPYGHVIAQAPPEQRGVVIARIQPALSAAPLLRWRYYPTVILSFLFLGVFLIFRKRPPRIKPQQ